MRLRLVDAEGLTLEIREFEVDEAMALLDRGEAFVDKQQNDPPFGLLEILEERFAKSPIPGPEVRDKEILKRVNVQIFAAGIRQQTVEGARLRWFKGRLKLQQAARRNLAGGPKAGADLYLKVGEALVCYLKTNARIVQVRIGLHPKELSESGLIKFGSSNFHTKLVSCYKPVRPWFDFYTRFHKQLDEIDSWLGDALEAGGILCSEQTGNGDRLLHPEDAAERWRAGHTKALSFLYSSDLPGNWFPSEELPKKRARASKWMKWVFEHFKLEGRRVTAKDLKTVAIVKFDLTENAAREAWGMARQSIDEPLRNPSVGKKVSFNEIKELNNMG